MYMRILYILALFIYEYIDVGRLPFNNNNVYKTFAQIVPSI